jgi:hypothetical protein
MELPDTATPSPAPKIATTRRHENEHHEARTIDKASTDANADHDRGSRGIAAGDRQARTEQCFPIAQRNQGVVILRIG